jgi:hypothetical protein
MYACTTTGSAAACCGELIMMAATTDASSPWHRVFAQRLHATVERQRQQRARAVDAPLWRHADGRRLYWPEDLLRLPRDVVVGVCAPCRPCASHRHRV